MAETMVLKVVLARRLQNHFTIWQSGVACKITYQDGDLLAGIVWVLFMGTQHISSPAKHGVPLVFLPSHQSHMDYIIMSAILFNIEIPVPRIAAGDNLKLPLVSWVGSPHWQTAYMYISYLSPLLLSLPIHSFLHLSFPANFLSFPPLRSYSNFVLCIFYLLLPHSHLFLLSFLSITLLFFCFTPSFLPFLSLYSLPPSIPFFHSSFTVSCSFSLLFSVLLPSFLSFLPPHVSLHFLLPVW